MAKRIFLLPGFGENCSIYDPLIPYLKDYEILKVDYRKVLSQIPLWNTSGLNVVEALIKHYNIQPEDKLIGHSTGGYFSFLIREIQDNEICMISGFSEVSKVIHFLPNKHLTPFIAITGLIKSKYAKESTLKKVKGKPIEKALDQVMDQFHDFSNENLFKLAMILTYDEKIISIKDNPLRIHAKDDKVVRTPQQDFIEVQGGHFPLALDLQGVVNALKGFL